MIVLLFGLSGAGKSTIANLCSEKFDNTAILDGDILRRGLNLDLGFSREDRREALRRTLYCAREMSKAGLIVFIPMIAPYESDRVMAREICHGHHLLLIFVDCPLETCEERDPKGLYKKARQGRLRRFTGVSDPFEAPQSYDLHLNTVDQSPNRCREVVCDYINNLLQ